MKKRLLKNAVAMLALIAMLTQSVYSGVAVMASELPEVEIEQSEPEIVVETAEESSETAADAGEPAEDEQDIQHEETEAEVEPDATADSEEAPPADEAENSESYDEPSGDDDVMVIDEAEKEPVEDGAAEDGSLKVLSSQISGSGLDHISIYVDTENLNNKDRFRIIFTGADGARYDTRINDDMDASSGGTYTFEELNQEGFNIHAKSDDDVEFEYSLDGDTPVIKVISVKNDGGESLTTGSITLKDGTPIDSIVGEGFENVIINLDTLNLDDEVSYTIYVNTDADVSVNGEDTLEVKADKGLSSLKLENLDYEKFTVYAAADSGYVVDYTVSIDSVDDGEAAMELSGRKIRTKTVYTYEDSIVSVTATLDDPEAVPDGAELVVTPITTGKTYDVYMKALNDDADKIDSENSIKFTKENTLLYDIAFMSDGKECELEEGKAKISIVFKKNQISEDLGIEDSSDVTVIHMPISDEAKENAESTLDADVTADDIDIEVLTNTTPDGSEDEIEFVTDGFSVYVVYESVSLGEGSGTIQAGTARSMSDILGKAYEYGIVSNEITLGGHLESNIAVGSLHGDASIQAPKNNGGGAGYAMIGAYDGSKLKYELNGNAGCLYIYTTLAAADNFGFDMTHCDKGQFPNGMQTPTGVIIDYESKTEAQIKNEVKAMIDAVYTTSKAMFGESNAIAFSKVQQNGIVDIAGSTNAQGTYYINFEEGEYTSFKGIKLATGQIAVLNIPDTTVNTGQYTLEYNGNTMTSNGYQLNMAEHVVFNCPNATTASTSMTDAAFLFPSADYNISNVSAGWLVANYIGKIGGQEWHSLSKDIPIVNPTSVQFHAKKYINGTTAPTEDQTFTFLLQDITNGSWNCIQNKTNSGTDITFDRISYSEEGTYIYDLGEWWTDGNTDYIYDETHYRITVNVIKSGNNLIVSNVSYKRANNDENVGADGMVFTNYTPVVNPTKIQFSVRKTLLNSVTGEDIPTNTFELYETGSDFKYKSGNKIIGTKIGETVSVKGNGIAEFAEIEFNENKIKQADNTEKTKFYYVVKENDGVSVNGWKPTDDYYAYAKVFIGKNVSGTETSYYIDKIESYKVVNNKSENADGSVSNTREYTKIAELSGSNTYTFNFTNIKERKYPEKFTFKATKNFAEGSTWPDGFTTTLRLVALDSNQPECRGYNNNENWVSGAAPMPSGSSTGSFTFPDGTEATNVQYKDVVVSKNNPVANFGEVEFPYDIPEGTNTIVGNLEGEHMAEDARARCYMYKIYEVLPNGATEEMGYTVSFNGVDIKYSTTVQRIKLWIDQITDGNGNYRVVITPKGSVVSNDCGGPLTDVVFTNETISNASIEIDGKKIINPSFLSIGVGDYAFTISSSDASAPLPDECTVKNYDTDGNFKFGTINYTSADADKEYTYKIVEDESQSVKIAGMKYSDEEYYVTVAVTKTGNELSASIKSISKKDSTVPPSSVQFTNRLSAEGKQTFEAKKVYTKTLNGGEFTFKLEKSNTADGASRVILAQNIPNTSGGTVAFNVTETYTQNDIGKTFYYFITEEVPDPVPENGITYSRSEYRYTVKVEDGGANASVVNGKAQLDINPTIEVKATPNSAWTLYTGTPEFNNSYNADGEGSLSVQKNIGTGVSAETLANKTFTFKVVRTDSNGNPLKDADGDFVYSKELDVTGSGTAVFEGIVFDKADTYYFLIKEVYPEGPEGVDENGVYKGIHYDTTPHKIVMEVIDNGSGTYEISNQTNDGKTVDIGTPLEITNTYTYSKTETTIEGYKKLNKSLEAGKYEFELTAITENAPMPAVAKVSNGVENDNEKFVFGPITFTAPDTYEYKVQETEKTEAGVTNNRTAYKVVIVVDDNHLGELEVKSKKYYVDETEKYEIEINNTYAAEGTAVINARKDLKGDIKTTGSFEFELTDGNYDRIGSPQTVTGSGSISFPAIEYTFDQLEGQPSKKFTYYVHEVQPDNIPKGYTYDNTYHPVVVTVINDTSTATLYTVVTYDKAEEKKANAVIIENEYKADGKITLTGTKKMVGRALKDDDKFGFKLTPKTAGDTNQKQTVYVKKTSKYNGTFKFAELTYTKTGDFVYEVQELDDNPDATDLAVRTVTVHVTDESDTDPTKYGELTTSMTVTGGNTSDLSFVNTVTSEGEYTPLAYKSLINKTTRDTLSLDGMSFSFSLTGTGTTESGKTVNVSDSASSNSDGLVRFKTFKYDEPGTYEYIIKENEGSTKGVEYSKAEYRIVINVTDPETPEINTATNKYGLTVTPTYYIKDGDGWTEKGAATDVKFENEYKTSGSKDFTGVKIYEDSKGNELTAAEDEFSFTLTDPENRNTQTVKTNGNDNKLSFTLNYTEKDLTGTKDDEGRYIKRYTLEEDKGSNPGVNYSEEEFLVVAYLKDNKKGDIDVDIKIAKADDVPEEENKIIHWIKELFNLDSAKLEFKNTYDAYGRLVINAEKILTGGKPLTNGMFTFTLSEQGLNKSYKDPVGNVGNSVTFTPIEYTLADVGDHVYTIKEEDFSIAGVSKIDATYIINVNVSDKDHNGTLKVTTVVSGGTNNPTAEFAVVEEGTDSDRKRVGVSTVPVTEDAAVRFINNYTLGDAKVTIGGVKKVVIPAGVDKTISDYKGQFSFVLESAEDNPKTYSKTVKNGEDGSFKFPEITFTQNDLRVINADGTIGYAKKKEFKYTVTEENGSVSGIDYDKNNVKNITVLLKDNRETGVLTATVVGHESTPNKSVEFNNTLIADDGITITVQKKVKGTSDDSKKFRFQLIRTSDEKVISSVDVSAGDGAVAFPVALKYTYDQVVNAGGTYTEGYTIKEDPSVTHAGYTNSTDTHTVGVRVTYDDVKKQLNIVKMVDGKLYTSNAAIAFEFENPYTASGKTEIDGEKLITGGLSLTAGMFGFELSGGKLDNAITVSNGYVRKSDGTTQLNNDVKKFKFMLDGFTQEDVGKTYTYKLRELTPDKDSITGVPHVYYDDKEYTVNVTVEDNEDGTLKVTPVYQLGTNTVKSASFTNDFIDNTSVTFKAKKSVKNHAVENIFTFVLSEIGNDKKMTADEEVNNSGTDVNFTTRLEFNQDDIGKDFRYKITEEEGNYKVYSYDTKAYYAKVDVSIKDGNLVADRSYYSDEACTVPVPESDVEFENVYTSSTEQQFSVNKILNGFDKAANKGKYTFILTGPNNYADIVTVNGSGAASFKKLPYTQDDMKDGNTYLSEKTIEYRVKEDNGGATIDHIHYSDLEYTITVKLEYDAATKELKSSASTDRGGSVESLSFENYFTTLGQLPLSGTKAITGKQLDRHGYTFRLSKKVDGEFKEVSTVNNNDAVFGFTPGEKDGIKYLKYDESDIGSTAEYQVTEVSADDGSSLDETVYTVTDVISDYTGETYTDSNGDKHENGDIVITRTITKTNSEVTDEIVNSISFNNTYEAEGFLSLSGYKVMIDKSLKGGEYTFILKGSNGEYKTTNTAAKLGNKVDGYNEDEHKAIAEFAFDKIKFTQDDLKEGDNYLKEKTFYYTLTEEGKLDGVINGSDNITEYIIAVNVKHSGKNDHKLIVTPVITNDKNEATNWLIKKWDELKGNTTKLQFTNKYCATGKWDPQGTKELTGRTFGSGEFQFSISEINGFGGKVLEDDGVKRIASVPNEGAKVIFNSSNVSWLRYDIANENAIGKHYYKVEEIEPDDKNKGDIYDKTVFEYEVEVKDTGAGGEGSLVAVVNKVKIYKPGKEPRDEENPGLFKFTFKNRYEATGAAEIKLTKNMTGRNLGNDTYSFKIREDKIDGLSATVQNVGNTISFKDLDMLKYAIDSDIANSRGMVLGEHKYIITENDFTSTSVTKDKSEYRVTVTVTENMRSTGIPAYDGVLNADVTKVEKKTANGDWEPKYGWNTDSLFAFENTYNANVSLDILAKKHVKRNINLADIDSTEDLSGFKFVIYEYYNDGRTDRREIISTATSDSSGNVRFDTIKYSVEDGLDFTDTESITKYYRIEEIKPTEGSWSNGLFTFNGVTYDNTVYDFNVTLKPNGNSDELLMSVDNKNGSINNLVKAAGKKNTYEFSGGFDFTNIKPEYTQISGTKSWDDNVTDAASRPDVIIELLSSVKGSVPKVIDTYTIKAPATTYTFEKLPVLDENGNKITYSVNERAVSGYYSEKTVREDGSADFKNTVGRIFINKYDNGTESRLPGATLAIYTKDGVELEKWVTDGTSHKVTADLKAGTTYILKEIEAPKGYNKAPDVEFTVKSDVSEVDPQSVDMNDPKIIGDVKLHKVDADTRAALSGAEFAVYRVADNTRVYASGSSGTYKYSETSSNGRFMVNTKGELTITDLPYGEYYFVEVAAPAGYAINSEPLKFDIRDSLTVKEVTFLDSKLPGSVRLRKTNADGSRSLEGAVFELYAKTPRSASAAIASTIYRGAYYRVGTYTTNSLGIIEVEGLPWDDYYFVETKAPDGYEINVDTNGDPIVYTFTIGGTGSKTLTYDLGRITNGSTPPPETPPETPPTTPPVTPPETSTPPTIDSGRRVGGVLSGVLGVRAAPESGVLGERVGPVTGDAANIILWLLLLIACVGTIVAMIIKSNKRGRKNIRPRTARS